MSGQGPKRESSLRIEGFHVVRLLGRGGTGEVYLAREKQEGHLVALKVLSQRLLDDDRAFERFAREAILTSQLRHPNIVRVYELGEAEGVYYISMEFVNGPSLQRRLREGALAAESAVNMLCQVLSAMEAVHAQGIFHCDLKPGNILLADGHFPKVSDLGIAYTRGPIHGDSPVPAVGHATPAYVSPEQCVRSGAVDHRTDIYTLGATLYHALCGEPPFSGTTAREYMHHHVHTPPPDPHKRNASLPQALCDAVLRMMAKEPGERFQSCGEAAEVLRQAVQCEVPEAAQVRPVPHGADVWLEETVRIVPGAGDGP